VRRLLLLACFLVSHPVLAEAPAFRQAIAPLLQTHCLKCHAGKKARAELDLTTRQKLLEGGGSGPAIKPGDAAGSLLFQLVRDGKMPPRQPLAQADIDTFRRWIDAGAPWEGSALQAPVVKEMPPTDLWSLRPIRRPVVPTPRQSAIVRTPVDAFLLSALEAKGLSFAPQADRRTLIRRVYFDLIGLPPTPEQIDDFLNDPRADAYERLVDRLLASPQHGERWARHWLDVVRFAESHGYEMNTLRPNAWPYRDWVIRAFNSDLPFREFVRQQFAGDVLAGSDPLTSAATGFLVAGAHDMVGNATLEGKLQQRADDLFDIVATTGSTFLGLTVGCARCHDHKFDPIGQKDFYALQALVAGVEHAERDWNALPTPQRDRDIARLTEQLGQLEQQLDALEAPVGTKGRPGVLPRRNVERFAPIQARFVRFTVLATTDGTEPCIDELELYGPGQSDNLALASRGVKPSASSVYPNSAIHRIEHLNDGQLGNSRSWISNQRGGWVQLELPSPVLLDRIIWGRDRQEQFRDRLASRYRIEVSLTGKDWVTVASHEDRLPPGVAAKESQAASEQLREQQRQLQEQLAALRQPPRVYAGTFRTPDVVHRLRRGDVMQKLEVVPPGGIAAIRPALELSPSAPEPQRRLALADWLTHPDNPLPARVIVNRLWHWHFGQGLVRTPGDFGNNGDRPSHPELLDWLADTFRASGGSFKAIHRLIVLSTAYRQSSRHDSRAASMDADNRLLWRYSPRRLEAEALRDALLQTAGSLDLRMGGPGYHLWEYSGYVIVFKPKPRLGPTEFRRMIYQFKPRLQQDGTFGAFDCPDATTVVARRNVSTTALQALNLLNDPFVLDQADRFAGRVQAEVGSDPVRQVERAFRLALGRSPSEKERSAAVPLVQQHGLALLGRTLFNTNEFLFVH
jgi:hypothetical protein